MKAITCTSFLRACALSIAMIGAMGCMGEEEGSDDVEGLTDEEGLHEDVVGDPELAAEIARTKLAELARNGIEVPSLRHAPCGTVGPNLQNQVIANVAINGAANQRRGSATGCGRLGILQPGDDARYRCWTLGNDGFTWTYACNTSISPFICGWTRDNLLRNNGSNRFCGF